MRCLYCGKELALLKRLTGGGEFCSEAHKQSYQEEYNRLALSRLLQAQKKKGQQANTPAQTGAPPPAAVAVEESAPEPSPETSAALPEVEPTAAETLAAEIAPETETAPAALAEPEPVEPAGFLPELLPIAASAEAQPYQEPWLELALSPSLSSWQGENPGTFELSPANLQALDWALNSPFVGPSIEDRAPAADLSVQAWPSVQPAVSSAAAWNRTSTNHLPSGEAIALQIAPVAGDPAFDRTFVHPVPVEGAILVGESEFLYLSPTSIEFPAEDADVVVLEHNYNGARNLPPEDTTPRSSLEALSRLHQEMIEEQEAQADAPPEEAAPVESVAAVPEIVATPEFAAAPEIAAAPEAAAPEVAPGEEPAAEPVTIDIVADTPEPAAEESRPAYLTELLEISLRIFPPSKGTPRAGELLPPPTDPLLPHLKALPLRPKVALAKGYAPGAPASAEAPATSAAPPRKPAPRPMQAKPTGPSAKPAQWAAAKPSAAPAPAPQPAVVAKAESAPVEKAPPMQPAAAPQEVMAREVKVQEVKAQENNAQENKVPEVTVESKKTEPASNTLEQGPPSTQTKPEPSKPEPAKSELPKSPSLRPEPGPRERARSESGRQREDVPTFGIATQSAIVPWYGSLKVKLGIALLLVLIPAIYFLGWGGKSHGAANSNPASGDASGPSIILGEGGWVEGWAGDPSGLHAGRQITIYRPSLKLSDYRIEFQASIDVKSIGWVFRATDPQNYYAMKIATVSPALPLKVALFKYLVANGRQTQVGRVPIDMAIQPDTVFNIREDVRGPHFTTYIQGQQIDSWTDDQLKVGGVGFLNEREERGKVSSVSIRYLTGGK